MSSPSPTQQPSLSTVIVGRVPSTFNSWMQFQLQGFMSPGTIPRGGVKGFKRETGWDIKKGKGTQGATLTLLTLPPVEGTITMQLVTDQDFTDWDTFVEQVLAISPSTTATTGLSIYYPQFASIGLTTVVIKHYTGPEHVGRGIYHASVELIEWSPPPNVSVVNTVASTSPDKSSEGNVPAAEAPELTQAKQAFAAASQAAFPNGGGSSF